MRIQSKTEVKEKKIKKKKQKVKERYQIFFLHPV